MVNGTDAAGDKHRLRPNEIVSFYAEKQKVFALTAKEKYTVSETLTELETSFGSSGFFRISKSELVNLRQIRSLDMSLTGTIRVIMKTGYETYTFVKVTSVTSDGEVASKKLYELDEDVIEKEAAFDGFYAVCTNLLDDDVEEILSVSEGRWKIEESFRILKTDFESRPVYVSREDRIKAHFLTCYLALLIFRLLEKKLGPGYTSNQIIQTLRDYNLLRINGEGYLPEYTRTALTDRLHESFGFRTDTEIVPTRKMRAIIASTKK